MKSFETRLARLEELSEAIKAGDLPLEEAVALFEEGVKLSKGLEKELAKIERKVEILVNNPEEQGEEPEMELFPELSDDDQDKS
jgi:exodeoxyribonuclease VII small subunit